MRTKPVDIIINISYAIHFELPHHFGCFEQYVHKSPKHHERRPHLYMACTFMVDNVGRLYPIFASVIKHAMTAYFSALVLWDAFIPVSKICTTPLPLLAVMEKPIRHWMNRPFSTSKLSTFMSSASKFESVSSNQ